ncbi:hypothetical protein AAE250_08215 [Bacteroides sp. GD17]|jgi:hypothetical protein|uniref:hypothetical protein n=1 Tax=Bacteroides sp. GD17 TaxID=3139826 RepID=UPI0025F1E61E|nr:hypothetical protein [uncultured Bacteroides sp.]
MKGKSKGILPTIYRRSCSDDEHLPETYQTFHHPVERFRLFNLQEKNAHPIFADVTETQTPFLPNGRHEKIAAEVFLAFIDNTNFILLIKTRF